MSHVTRLSQQKHILETRFAVIKAIREWFFELEFTEVDAPALLRLPGQEPYLSPVGATIHNERGHEFKGYLHTSPEYAMKKLLAAGFEKIFFLGKVFRDYESFGGTHNPEFTMIEWYRANADFYSLMDDTEKLIKKLWHMNFGLMERSGRCNIQRVHMRDLWREYAGVHLDDYLTRETMLGLCKIRGFNPDEKECYEDLFYRIFLNEIEPKLADRGGVIIHHYPLPMAALSRPSPVEHGYAERMEVYIDGLEIANGFSELTDVAEQRRRLEGEQRQRREADKEVFAIDDDFVEAVGLMSPSAGIALGVDRLIQVLAGCKNIDDVLVLPARSLF